MIEFLSRVEDEGVENAMASLDDTLIPRKRKERHAKEESGSNNLDDEAEVRRSKRPRKSAGGLATPAYTPRGERAIERSAKKQFDGVVMPLSRRNRYPRKSRSSDAGDDNPGDGIKSDSEVVDQKQKTEEISVLPDDADADGEVDTSPHDDLGELNTDSTKLE